MAPLRTPITPTCSGLQILLTWWHDGFEESPHAPSLGSKRPRRISFSLRCIHTPIPSQEIPFPTRVFGSLLWMDFANMTWTRSTIQPPSPRAGHWRFNGLQTVGNFTLTTTSEAIRCTGSWPSTAPERSALWSRRPQKPWWIGPPRLGVIGCTRAANSRGCPNAAVGATCGASTSPPAP